MRRQSMESHLDILHCQTCWINTAEWLWMCHQTKINLIKAAILNHFDFSTSTFFCWGSKNNNFPQILVWSFKCCLYTLKYTCKFKTVFVVVLTCLIQWYSEFFFLNLKLPRIIGRFKCLEVNFSGWQGYSNSEVSFGSKRGIEGEGLWGPWFQIWDWDLRVVIKSKPEDFTSNKIQAGDSKRKNFKTIIQTRLSTMEANRSPPIILHCLGLPS